MASAKGSIAMSRDAPGPAMGKPPSNPLICIIGATGTGKSNLAIALAHHLSTSMVDHTIPVSAVKRQSSDLAAGSVGPKAEIINADAMQLYAGLPVITNKISQAEQESIPHHLLGHIPLDVEPWTVQQFRKHADKVIHDLNAKQKIPIVVGGTGYYVHGLLLGDSVLDASSVSHQQRAEDHLESKGIYDDLRGKFPILDASNEQVYAKLQEVDPQMAQRWHPNDRRKTQRSLEIYFRTGRKASELYAEQQEARKKEATESTEIKAMHQETSSTEHSGQNERVRYDPLIFWLEADDLTLKDRLNMRVDAMVKNGLLDEAQEMASYEQKMSEKGITIDKTKGVWVSIGFKEMEPWVEEARTSETPGETGKLLKLRDACLEAVKAGTRRYAKRQNRYIRIRLADDLAQAGLSNRLFLLDCSNLREWEKNVVQPATEVMNAFLRGDGLPVPEDMSELAATTFATMRKAGSKQKIRIARRCEACDKILMSEHEWRKHLTSRSHKKVMDGIRKRAVRQDRSTKLTTASDEESIPE